MGSDRKHRPVWERSAAEDQLRERFRKLILSRGYTPEAAQGIVDHWFPLYILNMPKFIAMLEDYEQGRA